MKAKKKKCKEIYIDPLGELSKVMNGGDTNVICTLGGEQLMQQNEKYYIVSAYSNDIYKEIPHKVADELYQDFLLNQQITKKKNLNGYVE